VLVRLHTANFDFTSAKEDGTDLRFIDADDKTPLKYHVERFSAAEEMALVWVKVPRLTAGSVQETIWMYWGNEQAADAQDAAGTFDADQALVYHFDQAEGAPRDATAYGNHPGTFSGALGVPGLIGNGLTLRGDGDRILVPPSPSLDFSSGFTFAAWIRPADAQNNAVLFQGGNEERSLQISIDGLRPYVRMAAGETVVAVQMAGDLTAAAWQHLAVTITPERAVTLYLDGREAGRGMVPFSLSRFPGDLALGGAPDGTRSFRGDLDDVVVGRTARPAGWFTALYQSQGPTSALLGYGSIEAGEGGGVSTLLIATVADNITADGWIIIGLLFLLGALSVMLLVNKTYVFRLMQRENEQFLNAFSHAHDLDALYRKEEEYCNSPLFTIFRKGVDDLRQWGDKHAHLENPKLTAKSFNIFRTVLENGYMEQNRRINNGLVLLTLAISGGPFLGLLGTVWGVMNTFAALAVAGEANIMAIAPGVASALATTVAGLIVAIPALFGYNFLAGKVKIIAADLGLFVDQFANMVDQEFGD
jgi:biopolymer transport protein ExbB